jgi:hypothetical protein
MRIHFLVHLRFAILALALAGCEPSWAVVHRDLPEGLLSVWGRGADDVYAVGSDAGEGPLVLHYDGQSWERLATGVRGDLWWVNGRAEGSIFMVGAAGMILRYDGTSFTRMDTPADTGTVFGVWMAAEDDVWAVGGSGDREGFAWRYVGTAWAPIDLPGIDGRGLFKVWGNGPDDVWLVGAADEARGLTAAVYHWDGTALSAVETDFGSTLIAVHTDGDRAVAVGGSGTAGVLELEGGAWVDHSPAFIPQMAGVWLPPGDGGWSVGYQGVILRGNGGEWVEQETEFSFVPAFHSVWVDDEGGVGGQVIASPISRGVVVHRGPAISSEIR